MSPRPSGVHRWPDRRGGLIASPHVGQLGVFLELVKRERPEICDASRALEAWLGPEGIAGASLSGKEQLSIEAGSAPTLLQVEEVADSEDEGDEEEEGVLQDPASQESNETASSQAPLRQMSLLELFHPVNSTSA